MYKFRTYKKYTRIFVHARDGRVQNLGHQKIKREFCTRRFSPCTKSRYMVRFLYTPGFPVYKILASKIQSSNCATPVYKIRGHESPTSDFGHHVYKIRIHVWILYTPCPHMCTTCLCVPGLGRDIRRFSEDDFREDQKRPSGNPLFHDPDSFVLAFGSEIDVYGHSLDRSLSLRKSEANSFLEFLVNSILLLLGANTVSLPVHFSLGTPCSASAFLLDSILFRLCWTWRNLMEACRHGSFLLKNHVALSLRRFSNICVCKANRSGRLLHGCCVIWPVVKHGERLSPKSEYAVIAQALAICSTAVCYLLSVFAPTLSDADPPLAAAAARGEQGRRLSAAVLAERPVVSWWRAVSAQQGRLADQVTQGCARPFPDSCQVIS